MNEDIIKFITFIQQAKKNLNKNFQAAIDLNCNESTLEVLNKIIELTKQLEIKKQEDKLRVNYLNQFQSNVEGILSFLPFNNLLKLIDIADQNEASKASYKKHFEESSIKISKLNYQLEFNLMFFEKIGYFDNNIVAIGANGSGKTTLSNKFKKYLHNNGVVISAQRILSIPSFESIPNPVKTASKLKEFQLREKSNKSDSEVNYLKQEFGITLMNLLAENTSISNSYRQGAIESQNLGESIASPERTNLDVAFQIWNSLIEHRSIGCNDGMNIAAKTNGGVTYPAIQMSDGEKVMLYLIAQVLQAPNDGFILVDEPEMYLHKTVLKKLWNLLEAKRNDCVFIYLTHDLDFATSRTTAKKIWIKSFTHPDIWEIEDIPADEIPETLMFELLGSRKNILFCEGIKGSIDERVYSILFPELTIIPVGSCFDVINHTKAFNKLKNVNTQAYGLIDSDHNDTSRLKKLEMEEVYSFKVAEVENLFLDLDFLKILSNQLLSEESKVELIKIDLIKELDKLKEIQASNYVSSKINYYFTDSNVSKGNKLNQLEKNYKDFLGKVEIKQWYDKRILELQAMIDKKEYEKVLVTFNNKGIQKIACKHLKITEFTNKSIKLLQGNEDGKKALLKYFPANLKAAGNNF